MEDLDSEPSIEELKKAVNSLSSGKAPGKDGIPSDIIKVGKDTGLLRHLYELLCQCWKEGTIPHDMRDANIITLYKNKGDRSECNNYRGISLLSTVGKTFARVIWPSLGIKKIIENQGPEDYEYQLNLMFREDDEWWINDCMKPFLQGRMPHLEHIVFGDNGLHPGSFYLNAIYDVIENSYKTVLLLSNQSVEDTWFMTKLRMAVEHMNDTKLEKIILIFLEDIDDDHLPYLVRLLLSRNKPYLLWVDDDEDGQEFFWAKFEKSMRANREMNNVIPV
eukprot:XP_011671789.1 PREDICTED: toll-like receptor 2 [Strongylocentrotus purpuratus]